MNGSRWCIGRNARPAGRARASTASGTPRCRHARRHIFDRVGWEVDLPERVLDRDLPRAHGGPGPGRGGNRRPAPAPVARADRAPRASTASTACRARPSSLEVSEDPIRPAARRVRRDPHSSPIGAQEPAWRPRRRRVSRRRTAREITTSSPRSTRSSSRDRWVLASCTLTDFIEVG